MGSDREPTLGRPLAEQQGMRQSRAVLFVMGMVFSSEQYVHL